MRLKVSTLPRDVSGAGRKIARATSLTRASRVRKLGCRWNNPVSAGMATRLECTHEGGSLRTNIQVRTSDSRGPRTNSRWQRHRFEADQYEVDGNPRFRRFWQPRRAFLPRKSTFWPAQVDRKWETVSTIAKWLRAFELRQRKGEKGRMEVSTSKAHCPMLRRRCRIVPIGRQRKDDDQLPVHHRAPDTAIGERHRSRIRESARRSLSANVPEMLR
jgi:hypothetical protein